VSTTEKDIELLGVAWSSQGDHGTGFGLLQWTLALALHNAPVFGSGADVNAVRQVNELQVT